MMKTLGKIGKVEIGRVYDSSLLGFTAQTWFPKFTREAAKPHEHWLCPDHYDPETGRFPMPVHSWLLKVGNYNVLIDTCMGNDKARRAFAEMHHLANHYLERLAEHGLQPEDIHFVLCTHLHVDHVGWNTRLVNGRWVPTFPNARYVFSRVEYEAAKAEAAEPDCAPYLRQTFEDSIHPVVESGKMMLVEDLHELFDCLLLRQAPGHSPGHVRIELRSEGDTGVFAGDLLHSPMQVPLWQMSSVVCWDQDMAATARRELLEFCADENALLIPGHFEAPYVGRVRRDGDSFALDLGW